MIEPNSIKKPIFVELYYTDDGKQQRVISDLIARPLPAEIPVVINLVKKENSE